MLGVNILIYKFLMLASLHIKEYVNFMRHYLALLWQCARDIVAYDRSAYTALLRATLGSVSSED